MRKSHLIFALIGGILFTWVIARIGLSAITHVLRAMRNALPIVLVLSACRLVLQSMTWSSSLEGEEILIDANKSAGVRLASQSIGYLTVLSDQSPPSP
jgi:hypothetical protein